MDKLVIVFYLKVRYIWKVLECFSINSDWYIDI